MKTLILLNITYGIMQCPRKMLHKPKLVYILDS